MEEQTFRRDPHPMGPAPLKEEAHDIGLEHAFSQMEKVSESLLRFASDSTNFLKKIRLAARVGDLSRLRKALQEADDSTRLLRAEFENLSRKWNFDDATYLESQAFQNDLLQMGKRLGVEIYEHEGVLYSYPVVLRILSKDRTVAIDRYREVRLRPSHLVKRLKELQNKPVRFKPQAFLDILFSAYSIAVSLRGKHLIGTGLVVPLLEIYELLTLLPWQSAEYTKQEFARDIYFLDKSGATKTKKGQRLSFHASTGTRDSNKFLTVMGQGGRLRTYYGTSFVQSN